MADEPSTWTSSLIGSQKQGMDWMEEMLALAKPDSVFGEPVTNGEYTVVTTSEAWAGMGYGFGMGGGTEPGETATGESAISRGEGGGGGGGGVATGRPVAAIEVGPKGVRVEQIVDVTKLGLAFISVVASIAVMRGRTMRRG